MFPNGLSVCSHVRPWQDHALTTCQRAAHWIHHRELHSAACCFCVLGAPALPHSGDSDGRPASVGSATVPEGYGGWVPPATLGSQRQEVGNSFDATGDLVLLDIHETTRGRQRTWEYLSRVCAWRIRGCTAVVRGCRPRSCPIGAWLEPLGAVERHRSTDHKSQRGIVVSTNVHGKNVQAAWLFG